MPRRYNGHGPGCRRRLHQPNLSTGPCAPSGPSRRQLARHRHPSRDGIQLVDHIHLLVPIDQAASEAATVADLDDWPSREHPDLELQPAEFLGDIKWSPVRNDRDLADLASQESPGKLPLDTSRVFHQAFEPSDPCAAHTEILVDEQDTGVVHREGQDPKSYVGHAFLDCLDPVVRKRVDEIVEFYHYLPD